MSTRVVVLDDYQQVARSHGDWDRLGTQVAVTYLDRHLTDDELVAQLQGAPIVCIMRERTPSRASCSPSSPTSSCWSTPGCTTHRSI